MLRNPVHELYIAESIHRIAIEEAQRGGAKRITAVTVEVGALSGVVVDSLVFAFPAVAQGGLAEGARIQIEKIPGSARCPKCKATFELSDYLTPCPRCDHLPAEVTAGRELRLKEIEVE